MPAKNWNQPVNWNREDSAGFTRSDPPITVFPSLCDWLDPEVPVELLVRFLQLIHETPNLTWLLLTKRPELWQERLIAAFDIERGSPLCGTIESWLAAADSHFAGAAPRNVWIGTSVEDQTRADERIPSLLRIPAAGRFLSVEPLLGAVGLDLDPVAAAKREAARCQADPQERAVAVQEAWEAPRIRWVIIGGESGPGARPCNVEWIRSIVRQCKVAEVPCFVKQLGSAPVRSWNSAEVAAGLYPTDMGPRGRKPEPMILTHSKGGDPAEWSEDLRVRQFPWATSTSQEAAQ